MKYWYVGATPPPVGLSRSREVLIHEIPRSLEPYLNDRINWFRFESRSDALAKLEELQLEIAQDNIFVTGNCRWCGKKTEPHRKTRVFCESCAKMAKKEMDIKIEVAKSEGRTKL